MRLREGAPEEAGLEPDRIDVVRTRCREWVDDGVHPAVVALVVRDGVIGMYEAFGPQGPEPDAAPLERDAIFPAASLSKLITATLLVQLVDDGLVGLTRPVREYVPEFTHDDVCVHHLLTHTAGLSDEDWSAAIANRRAGDIKPVDATQDPVVSWAIACGYDLPLRTAPGEQMVYCTYGYELAGEIVRRVSGRALQDLLQSRICAPLGMRDTHFVVPDELVPRTVRRAVSETDPWPIREFDGAGFRAQPWAGAGAYSTALDMAVFGQCLLDGGAPILSHHAAAEMTRNQIPGISTPGFLPEDTPHAEASWGYGWAVAHEAEKWLCMTNPPPGVFWHDGAGIVLLWVDPPRKLVGAFFTVVRREGPLGPADLGCCDGFVNAVTAAVE
jgi:CubicO group peptidase (beta-lactamase class C family)